MANQTKARIFTSAWVAKAKPGEHSDASLPGFGLRVSPKLRRTWFVRFRTPGRRERREKLGVYPDVGLQEARRRARIRLGEVAGGRMARWTSKEPLTFQEAAERALKLMADGRRERTIREYQRILAHDLLPAWGDRVVSNITRADVARLADEIGARAPIQANRTLSLVRSLFNTMLDLELVGANPASKPKRFLREEKPRDRALSKEELGAILRAVKEEGPGARAFFGLAVNTTQRAGAVAAARWREFNPQEKTWTIPPAEGRKFKKYPRVVPLNGGALQALRTLVEEVGTHPKYTFPSRAGSKEPHFKGWHNLVVRLRQRSGVAGWSMHDIRRSFRTLGVRELGIRPDVADGILGHTVQGVGFGHYESDKSTYLLKEKREALEAWGNLLDRLVREGEGGE